MITFWLINWEISPALKLLESPKSLRTELQRKLPALQ